MDEVVIITDDQPMAAGFFGEGRWLTDFITPEAIDVQTEHDRLTEGLRTIDEKIAALQQWVVNEIKYTPLVKGRLIIEGHSSFQPDLWSSPAITARVKVGNCANKAFLLASLLRNDLAPNQVYCVLGNLHNGHTGGHAWVQVRLDGLDYILEPTMVRDLVLADVAERYEMVHLFNDQEAYFVEGRTLMVPFTACYSDWLSDYLDWAFIEGRK